MREGCCPCAQTTTPSAQNLDNPLDYFSQMIPHCLAYARQAKADGRPLVGILCEFTPRELILAANAVPVCLCGGSNHMIAPAEADLPANLCPLIKSTYGYHLTRSNPFLEMADLVVAETTCDGKKKMYELMADSRPLVVLHLPHRADAPGGGATDAFESWLNELRRLRAELERRFHTPVTDDRLRAAIALMNRERRLRRDLAALLKRPNPPLSGRQLLDLRSSISAIPADLDHYEAALAHLHASPGKPAGVRVLMTGVPMVHGAERVLDLVEAPGATVVAMETCSGLKPILDDVDEHAPDPLRAIAEKYFHLPCSVMTRNSARLDLLRSLAAEYRPDCVIELIWQACLTYAVEAHYVRRLCADELHLPYLRIETDYAPSDSARLATRIEALYETVRQRQPVAPR